MNKLKRTVISVFAVILAILMSGCSLVQVNEEKDRNIVVATVNGQEIKKGEVLDQYISYYGQAEEYDKEIMKTILDSLVKNSLLKQKAESAGYVVNDDILKQASEDYEKTIKEYAELLKEQAGKNADPNTDYEKNAREDYERFIANAGLTLEKYLQLTAENIAVQNYIDEITKDLAVDDKDIEEYYQEELEFQKNSPSLSAYYSTITVVKEPATRTVKHILIKLSDADVEEISILRSEEKEAEADALRKEKLKAIEAKAKEVLAKLKNGEDFEKLLEEYGEDPGMKAEENKDGYKMQRDESMVKEFLDASFAMKKGEISDLVASDYGYHIIKVYDASEDVIAPLEDVRDEIRDALVGTKKSQKVNELMEQWLKEADIKKYENKL